VTDVIGSEQEQISLDSRFAHLHQLPIDDPADHRWLAVSVDSSECSRFGSPIDLVRSRRTVGAIGTSPRCRARRGPNSVVSRVGWSVSGSQISDDAERRVHMRRRLCTRSLVLCLVSETLVEVQKNPRVRGESTQFSLSQESASPNLASDESTR
jgi:hypothetical protein